MQSFARKLISQGRLWLVRCTHLSYVQPIRSLVGLAGVNVHHLLTVIALHSAAPLELALTLGYTFDTHGIVAPTTAHDFTAICAFWGLVAHSACCAQGAWKEMYIFVLKIVLFFPNKIILSTLPPSLTPTPPHPKKTNPQVNPNFYLPKPQIQN